jgi:hypothetical protein
MLDKRTILNHTAALAVMLLVVVQRNLKGDGSCNEYCCIAQPEAHPKWKRGPRLEVHELSIVRTC